MQMELNKFMLQSGLVTLRTSIGHLNISYSYTDWRREKPKGLQKPSSIYLLYDFFFSILVLIVDYQNVGEN